MVIILCRPGLHHVARGCSESTIVGLTLDEGEDAIKLADQCGRRADGEGGDED